MDWSECRIVAFDTETTGLAPFAGDRVIEFAAVELTVDADCRVTDVNAYDVLFNPGIPIPSTVTKVTGISDEDVAGAAPFQKHAEKVREMLTDAVVIAHNLAFDLAFLRVEFGQLDMYWPKTRAEVDTLRLSQRLMSELKFHRLEVVAEALSIPLDTAHRATYDAEACGRVFVEIARRYGAPKELDEMIRWADAVGPPPDTGHLVLGERGVAEFRFGPHEGKTVEAYPDFLHWMTLSMERRDGAWHQRFPDSVTEWARRWLRARASGRFRANARSVGSGDWGLDPAPWR